METARTCLKCGERQPIEGFRKIGRGYRVVCTKCLDLDDKAQQDTPLMADKAPDEDPVQEKPWVPQSVAETANTLHVETVPSKTRSLIMASLYCINAWGILFLIIYLFGGK